MSAPSDHFILSDLMADFGGRTPNMGVSLWGESDEDKSPVFSSDGLKGVMIPNE